MRTISGSDAEGVRGAPVLVHDTPVERYMVRGIPILVKREDLCCPPPGPPFSKMRGVLAHVLARPEKTIGVLDTYHSQAGWAVAYACRIASKHCVNYWPRYVHDGESLRDPQRRSLDLCAELHALKAGRSAVLFHQAKKDLAARFGSSYMMPNALKLAESVRENAAEAERTAPHLPDDRLAVVVSISSGTVAAGVLLGLAAAGVRFDAILHMGYTRSERVTRLYLQRMTGVPRLDERVEFVDEGYAYAERARPLTTAVPFPCNEWYDLKAFRWMTEIGVLERLAERGQIIFWNVGS